MFENFISWFICFILSLITHALGLANQEKSFFFIHIGYAIFLMLVSLSLTIFYFGKDSLRPSLAIICISAINIAIILFTTWGISKFFNVDFFVTYGIITIGQCLSTNNQNQAKSKNKEQ